MGLFLLWGNLFGSLAAGVVNVWAVRKGRGFPAMKMLRAALAFAYSLLYASILAGVAPDRGVLIGRALALGAWWGVWIVPVLLPMNVSHELSRVMKRELTKES